MYRITILKGNSRHKSTLTLFVQLNSKHTHFCMHANDAITLYSVYPCVGYHSYYINNNNIAIGFLDTSPYGNAEIRIDSICREISN